MELDLLLSRVKAGRLRFLPLALLHSVILIPSLAICIIQTLTKPVPAIKPADKPSKPRKRPKSLLRVMTFNIRCGVDRSSTYNLSRCVASILCADADIVLIQEVSDGGYDKGWIGTTFVGEQTPEPVEQLVEIHKMLAEGGRGKGWSENSTAEYLGAFELKEIGRRGTYGIGILAKQPAKTTKRLVYNSFVEGRQGRGAIACQFEENLWCVCTHLQHDPTGYEQEHQVVELLGWIESELGGGQSDIIVGGDFNAIPRFRGVRLMEEAMGQGRTVQTTFPLTKSGTGIRLDYLFVRGDGLRRLGGNKVLCKDEASDHFPVICEVELI